MLYGIYYFLIVVPVFIVVTILTALTTIIGCLLGGEKYFSYYPGMLWSRLACILTLCPVKVKGRKNIQKGQPYVVVANHQSAFDIFMIYGYLGIRIKWVMKAGIGKIPFVGDACRAAGFVFVDNSSIIAATKTVKDAEACVRKGYSVVVFPEGSRTYTGKMVRFKKGASQIALDTHLSILPITLNGPYEVLPIHKLFVKPHRIEMIIHEPIPTEGIEKTHKEMQDLANRAQEVIRTGLWKQYL